MVYVAPAAYFGSLIGTEASGDYSVMLSGKWRPQSNFIIFLLVPEHS